MQGVRSRHQVDTREYPRARGKTAPRQFAADGDKRSIQMPSRHVRILCSATERRHLRALRLHRPAPRDAAGARLPAPRRLALAGLNAGTVPLLTFMDETAQLYESINISAEK